MVLHHGEVKHCEVEYGISIEMSYGHSGMRCDRLWR